MRDFNPNGEIVGRPYQSVLEQSLTQKYPVGTKYDSFGKRWRYSRCVAELTPGHRGCPNMAASPWTGSCAAYGCGSNESTASGLIGSNFVDVVTAAHLHTLDEFQGGILTLYPAAGIAIHQYRIIGNDEGSDTTHFRVYIDPPLAATEVLTPCDIAPAQYMNVGAPISVGTAYSVVVVPEILVTSGYYFWGQTKGPCYVAAGFGDWTTASSRSCNWHTNGCVIVAAAAADGLQYAGYLLHGNATNGDTHIMLMLE